MVNIIEYRKKDIIKKTGFVDCILCGEKVFGYKKKKKYCNKCRKDIRRKVLEDNQIWRTVKHYRGERSSNWKGGVTLWKNRVRGSLKYKQWRGEVFKRDNYTCQGCNKKGGYLEAHRINSFTEL